MTAVKGKMGRAWPAGAKQHRDEYKVRTGKYRYEYRVDIGM
jgi:hypothetical protein